MHRCTDRLWWGTLSLLTMVGIASAGPTDGLMIHYAFEGDSLNGSTDASSLGVAGDGAMRNFDGDDFVGGKIGQALDFDGVNDWVDIEDSVLPSFHNRTIAIWARHDPLPDSTAKRYMMGTRGGTYRTYINVWDDGFIGFDADGPGGGPYTDAFDTTKWHHYAMVLSDNDLLADAECYVDGVLVGGEASIPQHVTAGLDGAAIGAYWNGSGDFFRGQIDDFRIYDRPLSQADIQELINLAAPWSVDPAGKQILSAPQGGDNPDPITYMIQNDDTVSRTFDIAEVDDQGSGTDYGWLSLGATQTTVPAASSDTVDATFDISTLAGGVYTAFIKFSNAGPPAHAILVEIELTIVSCEWEVEETSATEAQAVYTITNTGGSNLSYTVQKVGSCGWLSLDKTSGGPLASLATDPVTATVDLESLPACKETCELVFTNNCTPPDARTFTIKRGNFCVDQDLIIHYTFEGDVLNKAKGPSSAGVAGDGFMLNFDGGDFVPGHIGQALDFDGVNDYVEVADEVLAHFRNKTIAVWARRETVGDVTAPGGRRKITSARGGNYRMHIHTYDGATIGQPTDYVGFDTAGAGGPELPYAAGVNQWVHYAIVLQDSGALANAHHYVNGQLFGQEPGVSQHNQASLEGFVIGRQSLTSNPESWWGQIDDFRVYDSPLTQAQIQIVMNPPPPPPWPDADEDGDVDLEDFAQLQRCLTGGSARMDAPDESTCSRFDRDSDADLDEFDVNEFIQCGTGPEVPIDRENPPVGCDL